MNLKNLYNKNKRKHGRGFLDSVLSVTVSLGLLYGINFLWNYLAPVWGLPKLTYLQFLGTLFLIMVLKHLFNFIAIGQGVHPMNNVQMMEIIGKPPYEE